MPAESNAQTGTFVTMTHCSAAPKQPEWHFSSPPQRELPAFPEPNKRPVSSFKCWFVLGLKFCALAPLSCRSCDSFSAQTKSYLILFYKLHEASAPYLKCPQGGVCDYNIVKVWLNPGSGGSTEVQRTRPPSRTVAPTVTTSHAAAAICPPKYLLKSNTAPEFYLPRTVLPGDITINLIVVF